jgi:outer membrane protein TolC
MDVRMSAMTAILITALGLSPCAHAQTSGGEILTLDEAITLARSNNRDLKQYGFDISKRREALGATKSELYPRFDASVLAAQLLTPIDFTVKAGQLGTFPATGPVPGSDTNLHTPARPIAIVSVTATQPLTQLFRIRLFVAEHRLNVDAARFSFDEREQKLTDDVSQAYYQVLESQSQHESQQSALKYLQELQQLTERRFSQQAALAADALSVKAEVAKVIYQLTTIEDTLADRKEVLNHLLGRSLQTDFSVEATPASFPEDQDLAAARATALEHRPEIKQGANRLSQAELETKIEKTRYIPDISIQAGYMSPVNINFLPQNIGFVGALLTWQPWDWGKKHHNVQQDVLAEKQAALSVEDTREQILLDVGSHFRKLREARAHLAVIEAARNAEKEKLRNQQESYSRQAILLSDLLKQQASVAEAEDQYRQAIFGYWKARADFQKTLGEQ